MLFIKRNHNQQITALKDETASPLQPEMPDISAARQEIDAAQKTPGSFSIGKAGDVYQAIFVDGAGNVNETPVFASAEEAQQAAIQTTQPLRAEAPQQAAAQPTPDQAMQQTDDLANIPAFMRNGQELSPELEQGVTVGSNE